MFLLLFHILHSLFITILSITFFNELEIILNILISIKLFSLGVFFYIFIDSVVSFSLVKAYNHLWTNFKAIDSYLLLTLITIILCIKTISVIFTYPDNSTFLHYLQLSGLISFSLNTLCLLIFNKVRYLGTTLSNNKFKLIVYEFKYI